VVREESLLCHFGSFSSVVREIFEVYDSWKLEMSGSFCVLMGTRDKASIYFLVEISRRNSCYELC
jgi:hypothetical protein